MEMEELLTTLAETRALRAAMVEERDQYEKRLAESKLGQELARTKDLIKAFDQREETYKQAVYQCAIELFHQSNGQNKLPHRHVKIQMSSSVVYEQDDVEQWLMARPEFWYLLKIELKKRDFEKFVRAGMPIPGVTLETDIPKPVIASDLSDLLHLRENEDDISVA